METYILENFESFNLVHIFECGQCFRWKEIEIDLENKKFYYEVPVKEKLLKIVCEDVESVLVSADIKPGSTNVLRTVGKKAAALTLVCDILKGVVAIGIAIIASKIWKEVDVEKLKKATDDLEKLAELQKKVDELKK